MKTKAKPQRMCVVCRTLKDKQELIRIVADDQSAEIDESGKKNGRGAYICKSTDCISKAKKTNAFAKAFKRQIDKSFYDALTERYGQN